MSTPNPIRARGPIDLPKIQQAAADLLAGLGYDLNDESLRDTPSRLQAFAIDTPGSAATSASIK